MSKLFFLFFMISSCSTLKYLKYENEEKLRINSDFDKKVIMKEIPPEASVITAQDLQIKSSSDNSKVKSIKAHTKKVTPAKKELTKNNKIDIMSKMRQPDIENADGFEGSRRPVIDPFVVGEKIIHSVSYFGAEAGKLTIETKPFVEVNNRKSYSFFLGLKTSYLFSKFYSVDDYVENFLDYENLVPHVFKMNVRESGKLAQANSFFDNQTLKAQFWEKKYTEKNGEEQKNLSWDILPFSQNAFSGIFYMRIFKWELNKEYAFRVADDEKNIIFKATALEKLELDTDAGLFKAIKIKASVITRGALTQAGNFYIWISDDERKIILRTEAEIKIGKIVSEIIEYKSGL